MAKLVTKYQDWGVYVLLGAIVFYGGWLYQDFAQDDAFITFRYARNIAAGQGFVYNQGELTLGTTTPMYTLVLSLLQWMSGLDVRVLSNWVTICCLWMSGILLYEVGSGKGVTIAAAVAFIFVTNPLLLSAIQMETFFLLLIFLLSLKTYLSNKLYLTGVLLGLLILTRYETAIFACILGLHYLVTQRKSPFWLCGTAIIFLGWAIFAWITFGDIIPLSAKAKVTVLNAGDGYPFAIGAVIWWLVYSEQTGWYYFYLPITMVGFFTLLTQWWQEEIGYRLILAWTVLYFIAASFLAGSFTWYYGPLMPGLSILVVRGVEFSARIAAKRLTSSNAVRFQQLVFMIVIAMIVLQVFSWNRGWVYHEGRIVDHRYATYRAASNWLNLHAEKEATLATSEIGILGYYTSLKIVDLWGLVTPELLPWLAQGRVQTLNKAIEFYAPDYILVHEPILIELLQSSPSYRDVAHFGNGDYILYENK